MPSQYFLDDSTALPMMDNRVSTITTARLGNRFTAGRWRKKDVELNLFTVSLQSAARRYERPKTTINKKGEVHLAGAAFVIRQMPPVERAG
jgi:hypothetical protein